MRRQNVVGGCSRIHFANKEIKAEVVLRNHLDTLLWDDYQVLHSVTPIVPKKRGEKAIRDILILGFTQQSTVAQEIDKSRRLGQAST